MSFKVKLRSGSPVETVDNTHITLGEDTWASVESVDKKSKQAHVYFLLQNKDAHEGYCNLKDMMMETKVPIIDCFQPFVRQMGTTVASLIPPQKFAYNGEREILPNFEKSMNVSVKAFNLPSSREPQDTKLYAQSNQNQYYQQCNLVVYENRGEQWGWTYTDTEMYTSQEYDELITTIPAGTKVIVVGQNKVKYQGQTGFVRRELRHIQPMMKRMFVIEYNFEHPLNQELIVLNEKVGAGLETSVVTNPNDPDKTIFTIPHKKLSIAPVTLIPIPAQLTKDQEMIKLNDDFIATLHKVMLPAGQKGQVLLDPLRESWVYFLPEGTNKKFRGPREAFLFEEKPKVVDIVEREIGIRSHLAPDSPFLPTRTQPGDLLEVRSRDIGRNMEFAEIVTPDGQKGYISTKYLFPFFRGPRNFPLSQIKRLT